jgi:hypothetical protein
VTDNGNVFGLGAVQTGSESQNGALNIISHTYRSDSLITIYKKISNSLPFKTTQVKVLRISQQTTGNIIQQNSVP